MIGIAARNWLNEELCWKDWVSFGSLELVRSEYRRRGIINRDTGEPPTISAIQKAAYRWVLRNLDTAREQIKFEWERKGRFLTDDEWNRYLYRMGKLIYYQSPLKFVKFIEDNGLKNYAN